MLCGHQPSRLGDVAGGSLLVGALAVHRGGLVFIALQFSTLTSAAIILYLAQKYRGMVCQAHEANPATELAVGVDHLLPPREPNRSALDPGYETPRGRMLGSRIRQISSGRRPMGD